MRAAETSGTDAGRREIGPISVVVCNYNGEGYLPGCLDSILAQEGAEVDEVIVVDNCSEDESRELLRERYPSVRLIELDFNGGPCVARNVGMRAARNRWIFAVDNDAVLLPDVLGKLVEAVRARPDAAAVQPRSVLDREPERVHYDGARFHYAGLLSLRNFYAPLDAAEGEGVVPVDGVIAIAILLNREIVLGVGAYDEDFFILFEDYDLALRLRIAGHGIYSVEDALVRHRGGTPGISFRQGSSYPKIRAFYHSRNRWLVLVKNHRAWTLLVSLPGLVVYELVWAAFTVGKGHFKAYLWGKLSFLRSLPCALRARGAIQRGRRVPDRRLLVGGPLTLSPELVASRFGSAGARVLDGWLRGWWAVARRLC